MKKLYIPMLTISCLIATCAQASASQGQVYNRVPGAPELQRLQHAGTTQKRQKPKPEFSPDLFAYDSFASSPVAETKPTSALTAKPVTDARLASNPDTTPIAALLGASTAQHALSTSSRKSPLSSEDRPASPAVTSQPAPRSPGFSASLSSPAKFIASTSPAAALVATAESAKVSATRASSPARRSRSSLTHELFSTVFPAGGQPSSDLLAPLSLSGSERSSDAEGVGTAGAGGPVHRSPSPSLYRASSSGFMPSSAAAWPAAEPDEAFPADELERDDRDYADAATVFSDGRMNDRVISPFNLRKDVDAATLLEKPKPSSSWFAFGSKPQKPSWTLKDVALAVARGTTIEVVDGGTTVIKKVKPKNPGDFFRRVNDSIETIVPQLDPDQLHAFSSSLARALEQSGVRLVSHHKGSDLLVHADKCLTSSLSQAEQRIELVHKASAALEATKSTNTAMIADTEAARQRAIANIDAQLAATRQAAADREAAKISHVEAAEAAALGILSNLARDEESRHNAFKVMDASEIPAPIFSESSRAAGATTAGQIHPRRMSINSFQRLVAAQREMLAASGESGAAGSSKPVQLK